MVAEMLQKLKFLFYVLYSCYIRFYFDYIFHIYVRCILFVFLILLYISIFMLSDFKFM